MDPNTNIWYNGDNKNPTWIGGVQQYGRKNKPTRFQVIPSSYNQIIIHVKKLMEAGLFIDTPVAILTGHIEDYKSQDEYRQRLKVLGKIATKHNIEGRMENVLYAKMDMEEGKPNYFFTTQGDGSNTARTSEGYFGEAKIPNDYKVVVDAILKQIT